MFNHPYRVEKVIVPYKPLYMLHQLMGSEVVPIMPLVYDLMQVMKENLVRQHVRDWMF